MIKVCFLVSSLANEGPVNVMYNIIKYMDLSIFDVSVITLIPEKTTSRIESFQQLPIAIHQLAKQEFLNPLQLFLRLKEKVREIDPHMLHAHCPRSLYLMCFLPKRYKRIYTIHIYPGLQQQILYGGWKGDLVVLLNNYFTRRTDLPIGCAESVSALYKQHKNWDIMSIPNGSSLPVWSRNEERKKQLREKYRLCEHVGYFIFVGRFSKEKNPDILVEAFKKLNDPSIGLIMLGDGPMWEPLKREESERLRFPGFTTEVYDYLIASDYYISASEVEGLANTLLESMTIGLPFLLSDIPSHKEVMSKMGRIAGYIINQHDVDDIVDKIKHLTCSIKRNEAEAEIKKVFLEHYTAERMSSQYQVAYQDLYRKNIK
ncbi:MAG: glycosyltransferase [Tannerellaceae bacterium]|jgi:glycosyltransferase involved in cell wall biosynthesis|nr:glycosyltransferase [Tannerellaceae bacterium]